MQRAEEALRCGEQLVGHVRWWRVAGLSHAASGGLLWHKAWTGLQVSLSLSLRVKGISFNHTL